VVEGELRGLSGYPVELHVARMRFVRERFRVRAVVPYSAGYWYVVLRRAPVERDGG
jgi:hypothetical protein